MKPLIFLSLVLHFFYAVFSVNAHDQHDGLRHWEIPSKDPDRIILTFHGDPSTSRAVTWRTDKTVTKAVAQIAEATVNSNCLLYTSPSPRDATLSRMPSSA